MLPKIKVKAATYPAVTSFTYNFDGYDYQFYFSGESNSPQDYRFDSTALDYVINKAAEGINITISSGIGAKIAWLSGLVVSSIFDFYRNFVIAARTAVADWVVWSNIYGFEFEFTGIDANYPGHESYGDAYGWRFTGWLGERLDLVLDSQGMIYGSNPIGNYTFSDDQGDLRDWSIHQFDGDDIWMPENDDSSYQSLLSPYIQGDSLFFYIYSNGSPYKFELQNFYDTYINLQYLGFGNTNINFYSPSHSADDYVLINHDSLSGVSFGQPTGNINGVGNSTWAKYGKISLSGFSGTIVLPNNYSEAPNTAYFTSSKLVNSLGIDNRSNISGSYNRIYLSKLTTSPLPDPIVLPVDDPIPVSDIDPDPINFDPDPDDDPDPVPGIDYPEPEPTPIPLPPIPTVVSGNDDLWPDLNDYFNTEDDIIDFTFPAVNVEFPDLSILLGNFVNSFTWVSTIITALFNGSDFSVLFSVLAFFFIAAAVLGIYKWWK